MAAEDKHIGHARCPLCPSTRARVGLSAKRLAYLTCNSCNAQVFARSDRSDMALRALIVPEPSAAPIEQPAPPAPAPEPKPPAPPPKPRGWGLMGG